MRVTPANMRDIRQLVNRRVVATLKPFEHPISGLVVKSDLNGSYYLLHDDEDFKYGDRPEEMHGYIYGWWLCYGDFRKSFFECLTPLDFDEKLGTIL